MGTRSGPARHRLLRPLLLAAACALAASCEFTLYPEGINPPKPKPPSGNACPNPFPGLVPFKTSPAKTLDSTLKLPAAVAVVPPGMSFSFTPEEGSAIVDAEPGDLLAVDMHANKIYFYDHSAGHTRWIFPSGAVALGGGVALYYEAADASTGRDEIRLLLYTGTTKPLNKSNLFLQDLDPASALYPNPFLIPDNAQGLIPGLTDFYDARMVAVGRQDTKRGVFVTDPTLLAKEFSVYRITLTVEGAFAFPDSMVRLASGFLDIRDVGYSQATHGLYMTEYDSSALNNSTVYRIASALTATGSKKSSLSPFVPASQLKTSTGLNLAPTRTDGTTDDLLVLNQQTSRALGRFDSVKGGFALDYMSISYEYQQAVAYDCTHERIVFTRRTTSPGLFEVSR